MNTGSTLRPYQADVKRKIYECWDTGMSNVLAVLPTGAGKTVIFADIIHGHPGASCAIAHRQELVSQISKALAKEKVRHRLIAPKSVIKLCVNLHLAEMGVSYYDPMARTAVAGVDTLIRRSSELKDWLSSVTLWVTDEAHHVLEGNKWGKGCSMFPNAKGLGVTATPLRADGKGLGRAFDGLFDAMVEGPGMRDLINMRYLTDYRAFAPPSDVDLGAVSVSKTTGDYAPGKLKAAVRDSRIVGDVVDHYMRIASGKLGITFATDVGTATDIAKRFNSAKVPAAVVSAKTPDAERIALLAKFKNRELLQLVNVDLFGEGFDLPAIEVVSMARPTQSYALYVQQFGRALRLLDGKEYALIIDHAGNVARHGLPDARREWTLARREKRVSSKPTDATPVKTCLNPECLSVYERVHSACPFCGYVTPPTARNSPEFTDGSLVELDASTLAAMRGAVEKVDLDPEEYRKQLAAKNAPKIGQMAHVKKHVARQEAQKKLRKAIAWWGGYQRSLGRPDDESYRRFYLTFGVDVLSAQALNVKEADALCATINNYLESL